MTSMISLHDNGIKYFFNSGSNFTNVEGAGRYQNRFREHEKLFWGAPIKKFREPGEKGQISKGAGSRGPPLTGSHSYQFHLGPFLYCMACVMQKGLFEVLSYYLLGITPGGVHATFS